MPTLLRRVTAFPINHGKTSQDTLLHVSVQLHHCGCSRRMEAYQLALVFATPLIMVVVAAHLFASNVMSQDAVEVVKQFMSRNPDDMRFNMVALGPAMED